jgi:hypothetical protein
MSELKTSEIKPELSPRNINIDLIHFKNDILKDVRDIKYSLMEKYSVLEENLKQKMNQYDLTIKSFEQKIFELSKLITIDKSIKEKIETFNEFKEETRDNIFKQRAKFNEFENRINKEISGINDILLDSVIYPAVIGGNSKFKTFHEYMDFTLKEINDISLVKDKNGMDLKPFKKKIEQTVDAFRIQINNMYTKEMTNNAINRSEERLQSLFRQYDEKIMNLKVENYGSNVTNSNKFEEINSKLKSLENFKKNIENNTEILKIKKEIKKIYEILRDFFSFPEIKKEIEKKNQVFSGVKQYINGFLDANQLTSMKKFSYGKSNSNGKIMERNNSVNITPFASTDKIKNKISFERKKLFNNNSKDINNELLLEKKSSNSIKDKEKNSKDNVFISQKGFLINKVFSKKIKENSSEKKLINENIETEEMKNDNSEKNSDYEDNSLDNRLKKIYKEEEIITNKKDNDNTEVSNPHQIKLLKRNNNNFIISEEDDENILSDNNVIKEKINKTKKNYLYTNIQNNKNISVDVSKKNLTENNINDNYTNKEGKLRVLNFSKDNNNIYNKNKSNLNSMKKLKEKEYNQSVPMLEIKKVKEKGKEKNNLNEIKISNKENVGTQSNESQFKNINQNIFGNKTYTYFPHIQKEKTNEKEKIFQNNSAFDKINNFKKSKISNISFLFNDENEQYGQYNQIYKKKPKKVLLINPDAISNFDIRKTTKSAKRNKSSHKMGNGFRTQKNLDKMVDEMIKGFVDKNKIRLITNGSSYYQNYNSLYDLITSYETSYAKNQNSKNKKK